jgi:phosphate transport system substrate-binding protein
MGERRRWRSGPCRVAGSAAGAWVAAFLAIAAAAPGAGANEPIRAAGSHLVAPLLGQVFDRLVEARVIEPPRQDYRGTERGLEDFCRSAAPDGISLVAMSRRMRNREFEECVRNGVRRILEIQIGFDTLVLAAGRNDADYDLSLRALYGAVARDTPADEEFLTNESRRWRDLDENLPDTAIRVVLPARGHGARSFFEDRFLQGACRDIRSIRSIFGAEARVAQCISLREDGPVVEVGMPYDQAIRLTMTGAPPGTIAVLPFKMASAMTDLLKLLPLDGVLPSPTTIATRTYPYNRPLFVYLKKAHVKDYRGNGPVAGLRELITELTRERTIGPDGYLTAEGMVPMSDERRTEVRERALRLATMER